MTDIWQASDLELDDAESAEPPRTNVAAIASMCLGIVWLWWVGSVAAIVLGHLALRQIDERGEEGRGMAVTGLVVGYTMLVALFVGVLA